MIHNELEDKYPISAELDPLFSLPAVTLLPIVLELDIISLANFYISDARAATFLNNPYHLEKLAEAHGLPYSKTFDELLSYSKMNRQELFQKTVNNNDVRVFTAMINFAKESGLLLFTNAVSRDAISKGNYGIVMAGLELLEHKFGIPYADDFNILGIEINESLINAVKAGHIEIVEAMIDAGANYFKDVLKAAVEGGNREIVRMMMKYDQKYDDALVVAARKGNKELFDMMIETGAEYSVKAFVFSALGGNKEIYDEMLRHNDQKILLQAILGGNKDIIENELSRASSSDILESKGKLVKMGNVKGLITLAELNLGLDKEESEIFMHDAAELGFLDIVQIMLDSGGKNYNETMLGAIYTSQDGVIDPNRKKIVKMMLDAGADNYIDGIYKASHYKLEDIIKLISVYMVRGMSR